MQERLELRYVPLSSLALLEGNAKLHDIDQIIESMLKHGFKDPPKYEPTLNEGRGGIVEGNGRTEALTYMQDNQMDPPRGILIDNEDWLVPVLFGVDANSQEAAMAYAVDHNNLTISPMADAVDAAAMYDVDAYIKMIERSAEQAVSVEDGDLGNLRELIGFAPPEIDDLAEELGEPDDDDFWPIIKVQVPPETKLLFDQMMDDTGIEDDAEAFLSLLHAAGDVE